MIDWPLIKARYEGGETAGAISRSLGGTPTKQGIYKKANKEGWEKIEIDEPEVLPVPQGYWDELNDKQRIVVEAFVRGASTIEDAAKRADVSERTIRRWKEDDRFDRLCMAARLATRDRLVSRIDTAGATDWKANAWLLERCFGRDEFAPANASQGFTGNTFNILGRMSLGIERPRKGELEK